MDRVLAAARPAFDAETVVDVARRTFDVDAARAVDLGSERDQAFLLLDGADAPLAVLKLSNAAEDPATLDMEALAVLHAQRVDPSLPLAIPWLVPGAPRDSTDPADRRVAVDVADGRHHVRGYSILPGRGRIDAITLSDSALAGWGDDGGPSRSGTARFLPPGCSADDALGRPARRAQPGAARRDPGYAASGARRSGA